MKTKFVKYSDKFYHLGIFFSLGGEALYERKKEMNDTTSFSYFVGGGGGGGGGEEEGVWRLCINQHAKK